MHQSETTIVVICHKRVLHLARVLSSLRSNANYSKCRVVVVAQDVTPQVQTVLDEYLISNSEILYNNGRNFLSARQAINNNVYLGLNYAFNIIGSETAILLEDDIVPSSDFLNYFLTIFSLHSKDRSFRGINAFSELVADATTANSYVKVNSGLGWGWGIHRKTFNVLSSYWTGTENEHWDFIIEPYIRTGYVINPIRSRILNIGFDETATHTFENGLLGLRIEESFNSFQVDSDAPYREMAGRFSWCGNDLSLSTGSPIRKYRIFLIRFFLFCLYSSNFSKWMYVPIKRRLERWLT